MNARLSAEERAVYDALVRRIESLLSAPPAHTVAGMTPALTEERAVT